jgi:HEPN domain-containing protein
MQMLDRTEFARWREAADGARRSAELQATSQLFNWACFLAEQGAQLGIKGLLHGIGGGAWGHDLVTLGGTLGEAMAEPSPGEVDAALRRLSRHYIPARYPDAHPAGSPGMHYGREDAEQAIHDLRTVLDHVDALWIALSAAAEGAEDGS